MIESLLVGLTGAVVVGFCFVIGLLNTIVNELQKDKE